MLRRGGKKIYIFKKKILIIIQAEPGGELRRLLPPPPQRPPSCPDPARPLPPRRAKGRVFWGSWGAPRGLQMPLGPGEPSGGLRGRGRGRPGGRAPKEGAATAADILRREPQRPWILLPASCCCWIPPQAPSVSPLSPSPPGLLGTGTPQALSGGGGSPPVSAWVGSETPSRRPPSPA